MIIQLVTETMDGLPPEREDLQTWADEFGLTIPVLSDTDGVAGRYSTRGEVSLPSESLLAAGAELLIADGDVEDEDLESALPWVD